MTYYAGPGTMAQPHSHENTVCMRWPKWRTWMKSHAIPNLESGKRMHREDIMLVTCSLFPAYSSWILPHCFCNDTSARSLAVIRTRTCCREDPEVGTAAEAWLTLWHKYSGSTAMSGSASPIAVSHHASNSAKLICDSQRKKM